MGDSANAIPILPFVHPMAYFGQTNGDKLGMSKKFDNLRRSHERKQRRRAKALERFRIIPHDDYMGTGDEHAAYILRKNVELQSLRKSLGV